MRPILILRERDNEREKEKGIAALRVLFKVH